MNDPQFLKDDDFLPQARLRVEKDPGKNLEKPLRGRTRPEYPQRVRLEKSDEEEVEFVEVEVEEV